MGIIITRSEISSRYNITPNMFQTIYTGSMGDLKFFDKLYWNYVEFEVFRQIILELLWDSMLLTNYTGTMWDSKFSDKLHWNYVGFEVFIQIILEVCGI
jgi:hypothetical protein